MTPQPPTAHRSASGQFLIQCEVLRLSAQPSGPVLAVQFLLDCGVAALFAWQYSLPHALVWIALIAATTAYRGFFPQHLPATLTPENLPPALRLHTLRIAIHEGAHGAAGVLLFNPSDSTAQLLLGVVIMAMTLSSAFSVSYHTPAMQLAITLLLAPVIAMGMAFGAPPMVALAVLGIGLLVMVWKLVAERSRQLEENIGLRHNESTLREQALAGLRRIAAGAGRAAALLLGRQPRPAPAGDGDGPAGRGAAPAAGRRRDMVTVQKTVASLSRAQQALEGLTNQLLEIGRIEAAADPLVPTAGARWRRCCDDIARQDGSGRVRVRCPDGAAAWTDAVALRRILANLVDNALKFAPRGRVLLACRRRRDGWRIEVRDGGIGIAADAQERVFGDFEQVGNVERNLQRGHGLGLAIVRRLAQRLGARSRCARRLDAVRCSGWCCPQRRGMRRAARPPHARWRRGRRSALGAAPRPGGAGGRGQRGRRRQHRRAAAPVGRAAARLRQRGRGAGAGRPAGHRRRAVRHPPAGRARRHRAGRPASAAKPELAIALVSADIDDATQQLARAHGWQALRKPVQPAALRRGAERGAELSRAALCFAHVRRPGCPPVAPADAAALRRRWRWRCTGCSR